MINLIPNVESKYLDKIEELNKELGLAFLKEERVTLQRASHDLIFSMSKALGNTYTLFDLETLLYSKFPSYRNTFNEATQIMNMKKAVDYAFERSNEPLTMELVSDFHTILASNLTDFKNLGVLPSEEVEVIITKSMTVDNPILKAIYLGLNLTQAEPFNEHNEIVAQLVQFHSMLHDGVVPLYTNEGTVEQFKLSLVPYCRSSNPQPYIEWFLQAYFVMYSKMLGKPIVID